MSRKRNAEERVIRTAMLCWKYEPVSSAMIGYTKRWDNLVKACAALDHIRKKNP